MDMIPLSVQARDAQASAKMLRASGVAPCVVYGSGVETTAIQCNAQQLQKTFVKAGESTLVELELSGKKIPVLFKAIDFHPVSDRVQHADFYAVNMNEEIETTVPVKFEGEAPAVKDLGAIFVATQEEVTVRCLPSDLPHELMVDVSGLTEFHMSVHVSDIKLPKGVEIMDDAEAVLATTQEPRAEEEIAPPPAEGEAAEGAPAEGAAATEGEAVAEEEK